MRLTVELEARFSRYYEKPHDLLDMSYTPSDGKDRGYTFVDRLAEADGLWMLCPGCYVANQGGVGTHMVMVAFKNAPDGSYVKNKEGKWPKWTVDERSTCLDDLILTPSIQIIGGCAWHGFIGCNGAAPGSAITC